MPKELDVFGEWWIPGRPDGPLPGVLRGDPAQGLHLTLLTKSAWAVGRRLLARYLVISGRSSAGEKFTLQHCSETGIRGRQVSIEVGSAIKGANLTDPEAKIVRKAGFQLKHLESWVEESSLRIREADATASEVLVVPVKNREIRIRDGLSLTFFRRCSIPFGPNEKGELLLYDKPAIALEFSDRVSVGSAWKEIEILRAFFSLAALENAEIEDVWLEVEPSDEADSACDGDPLVVDYLSRRYLRGSDKRSPHPTWYLFREAELGADLEKALQTWMNVAPQFEAARVLYLSAHYSRETIESKFLTCCNALEAFCSAMRPGRYMEPADFLENVLKPLVSAIPAHVKGAFRDAVKVRLGYLNEYSLRRQLRLLADENEKALESLGLQGPAIANEIADERNRLTHPPAGGYILDQETFDRLVVLARAARLLLELAFLQVLQLGAERTMRLAEKCQKYRHHFRSERQRTRLLARAGSAPT